MRRPACLLSLLAALVTFAVVQDRVTAAGARRYVTLQREALAGRGAMVRIDEVMEPAIRDSVRLGIVSGGAVLLAGGAVSLALTRRRASP